MCGIAGIAALKSAAPEHDVIKAMCATMTHRGPDDEGIEVRDGVGLGMRRLSIIDIAGGHQPVYNEDQTVRVVFNGEIYNFRELREVLTAKGHTFSTNTDTEVIVHAYEEYGAEFPKHLNGMFAIALHDIRKHRLLLVRDHVGIKPFYYACDGESLVWGSEVKVVMASGRVGKQLNRTALTEFMSWEYVPGDRTLFTDVKKLPAAHLLDVNLHSGDIKDHEYWRIPATEQDESLSENDWMDRVDEQIRKSVQMQLVSDVPLGSFLSGGVDSSLVVAAMGDAHTFSIGFDDPTYNELKWSQIVADHLGVRHTTEVIKPDIHDMLHHLMRFMDDPIGDFSIFPTYLVSKLAREHVTVCLSGDGGDELFGGYESYLANAMGSRIPSVLSKVASLERFIKPSAAKKGLINKGKRFLEGFAEDPALEHCRWRIFLSQAAGRALFSDGFDTELAASRDHVLEWFHEAGARGPLDRCLYTDFKSYLCDNILTKVDRMSMAVSLESRVPLLDKDLVELAFQVPEKYKLAGKETKSILKKVAARHIPASCVYRPKEGFSIPIKHWLKSSLKPVMMDMLDAGRIRRQGVFNDRTVTKLIEEHLRETHNHSHVLWSLIVFQLWHKEWMES